MKLTGKKSRLAGETVELRRHAPENYPLYAEWYGDQEIWRLTSWAKAPMSAGEVKRLFDEREIARDDDSFAIHPRGLDRPIGVVSLTSIDRSKKKANFSIIVGSPEHRGMGYGTEALELILEYGFQRLKLERIGLSVFEFNEQAISVYRRLGFKEEDRIRQAVVREGIYYDAILMRLLNSEWREAQEPLT
jgi:RimJ/RimL family protein N-acetyltransferase